METRKVVTLAVWSLGVLASGALAGVTFRSWTAERVRSDGLHDDLRLLEVRARTLRREVEERTQQRRQAHPEAAMIADSASAAAVLDAIEEMAGQSGVKGLVCTTLKGGSDGEQGYEVSGVGDPTVIARFFALVEQHPRLLVVHAFQAAARAGGAVGFSATLVAFHRTR